MKDPVMDALKRIVSMEERFEALYVLLGFAGCWSIAAIILLALYLRSKDRPYR